MIVNRATSITLEHRKATISTPLSPCDFQELSLKYSLYPAFRDVVRELAGSLGLQGAATLFEGVCGRCGRCCSSLEAIADSDELFAMASHLGLSEDDFISRHTVPALTWNPGDRALARKDGACVFLTRLGQRDPGSPKYACAVHPVKPRRCAALAPALAACLKRPCDLVEHIEKIEFSGELMKVKLQGRGEYLLPLALAPWGDYRRRLLEEAGALDGTTVNRLRQVISQAGATLGSMEARAAAEHGTEQFRSHCVEVQGLIETMARMAGDDPEALEGVKALRKRAEALSAYASGGAPPAPLPHRSPAGFELRGAPVAQLHFFPTCLAAEALDGGPPAIFPLGERLAAAVRAFLEELLRLPHEGLKSALAPGRLPCFMCGKCCTELAVEIEPSDVERLAEGLGLTEAEVRQRYGAAPRFGWNAEGMEIRRVPRGDGQDACPFLGRGEIAGLWYCTVYPFRPVLCRDYSTRHDPCREWFEERYPLGRLPAITSLRMDRSTVCVRTPATLAEEATVALEEHPALQARAAEILRALEGYHHQTERDEV